MKISLARRVTAEGFGTAFLVAAVVGSGISAQRLSGGNAGLALLINTIATGAALVALILTFGPISGAHLNPVVTLGAAISGRFPKRESLLYLIAQFTGGVAGAALANIMYSYPAFTPSQHVRSGGPQWISEFVATFGLILVIRGSSRSGLPAVAAAVGCYIAAAYWFTASTCFANPAVTIARSLTDTFAGIRPTDVPFFLVAQIAGGGLAVLLSNWLVPEALEKA